MTEKRQERGEKRGRGESREMRREEGAWRRKAASAAGCHRRKQSEVTRGDRGNGNRLELMAKSG